MIDKSLIEQGITLVLQGIGVDLSNENFAKTPQRVASLYEELLTPKANNMTTFKSTYDNMCILRGHVVHAICPHHLLPVEIRCHIGYLPNKKVLGLSKLGRVVEQHLTYPIMQEELGDLAADTLNKTLEPKGVGVILAGVHGCMRHRGIKSTGDVVTLAMRGQFLLNPAVREEFMRAVGEP